MSKRSEILEKAFADMKAFNKAAWDELCAGAMIKEEEELEKKIATLKKSKKLTINEKK
jgi:hypothetical protein